MKHHRPLGNSIEIILEVIHTTVVRTSATIQEAHAYMRRGEQNLAMGTAIAVEHDLETALVLYRAVLAMHSIKS